MSIQINNVLTGKKEVFQPVKEGEVQIYVCGVTVYGRCHVGHLRCYLSFDSILRYFQYRDFNLNYVRNFTDIDDKIIARAMEITAGPEGDWRENPAYVDWGSHEWDERLAEDARIRSRAVGQDRHLAEVVSDHFIEVFRNEDFGPFGLIEPRSEPRVSEHIPQVVELIEKIIERGFAYAVDGEVYFDVPAYHESTGAYGKLSGRDYTQLLDGARVRPNDKKKSGVDFALWKNAAPGEPAWDSPWGSGRPGWHIECSAMSLDKFSGTFDIHGGGKDLIFPHHENEIAQSESATGRTFCGTWIHNGFVTVGGVKMSKSLGNFLSIKDALEIAPPEVWRHLILSTHYANPIDISRTKDDREGDGIRGTIDVAFDRLEYFYETLLRADEPVSAPEPLGTTLLDDHRAAGTIPKFIDAMDDDFNTAKALANIGEALKYINELADMKAKKVKKLDGGRPAWLNTIQKVAADIREVCGVLGLLNRQPADALKEFRDFAVKARSLDAAKIEARLKDREEARENKDWALSDTIRDELKELGIELRDSPSGTQWKVVRKARVGNVS
jgi:cysteinyl-tRNA synthetase